MTTPDAEQMQAFRAEYANKGYVVIRRFVEPEVAAGWEAKHRSLPGNKVHVGYEYGTVWTEQLFSDPTSALDGMVGSDRLETLIKSVAGLEAIDWKQSLVWINRYGPGDHVPRHCDSSGDTQFLVCLQGLPEPEKGGDLLMRDEAVRLNAGDAILFFARGVPHATSKIGSSTVGASGFSRVTCVIRLFAPTRREGETS